MIWKENRSHMAEKTVLIEMNPIHFSLTTEELHQAVIVSCTSVGGDTTKLNFNINFNFTINLSHYGDCR